MLKNIWQIIEFRPLHFENQYYVCQAWRIWSVYALLWLFQWVYLISSKIIVTNHVKRGTDKKCKGYECIQFLVLCGKITLSTSKQSPNIILLRAPRCRGPALHLTITNCSMQFEYFAQRKWRFCLYRPIFVDYNCKRKHTITLKQSRLSLPTSLKGVLDS